jgi:hypothetical protein
VARKKPPRRDSSFTQETTSTTFKWRTSSEALTALEKGTAIGFTFAVPIFLSYEFPPVYPSTEKLYDATE